MLRSVSIAREAAAGEAASNIGTSCCEGWIQPCGQTHKCCASWWPENTPCGAVPEQSDPGNPADGGLIPMGAE